MSCYSTLLAIAPLAKPTPGRALGPPLSIQRRRHLPALVAVLGDCSLGLVFGGPYHAVKKPNGFWHAIVTIHTERVESRRVCPPLVTTGLLWFYRLNWRASKAHFTPGRRHKVVVDSLQRCTYHHPSIHSPPPPTNTTSTPREPCSPSCPPWFLVLV